MRSRRTVSARLGWGVLLGLALAALVAPWLAPYDPRTLHAPLLPPSPAHPLGTNDVGQDILSELLHGARFSLALAALAAVLSTGLGGLVGVVAGYYPRLGFALMRVVDVFLAIPRFPLIIFLAAFLRPGFGTLLFFFVLFGWARTARLLRARVLQERSADYVDAAIVLGARDRRILLRHLLPSVPGLALVRFIGEFQHVLLAESGLSFLGLGDPTVKSWGAILHYAFDYPIIFTSNVWLWWALPPGLAITLVTLALTAVGFVLETQLNPKLRKRGRYVV